MRDQQSFQNGALLDIGLGFVSIGQGSEPHGDAPYEITPETAEGSYFENLTGRSQRLQGTATLYLPAKHWAGRHDLRAGIDLDHITYNQEQTLAPVSYLREDGTLQRQSVFLVQPMGGVGASATAAEAASDAMSNSAASFTLFLGYSFTSPASIPNRPPRRAATWPTLGNGKWNASEVHTPGHGAVQQRAGE